MYCENCGNKIKKNYKFCDKCGSGINTNNNEGSKVDKKLKNIKIISISGLITSIFGTKGLILAIVGIYEDYKYKKINGKNTNYLIINIITIIISILMFIFFIIFSMIIGFKIVNIFNNPITGEYNCINNTYSYASARFYDARVNFEKDGTFIWAKYIDYTNNYIKGEYELSKKSINTAYIKMKADEYVVNGKDINVANDIKGNIIFDEDRNSFTIFINNSTFQKFYCTRVK